MFIPDQQTSFGKSFSTHRLPQTQYLGSKQKWVEWIYRCSPQRVKTVFDAFSGTSSVGYYFKTKGKRVIANDFLKFNYHIGKALVENQNQVLTDQDIRLLLQKNKTAENFIESTFSGVFFEQDQARFLDHFRSNIRLLDNEYKKSLAFTVMNRALTRKVLLGHFAHLKALDYSKNPARVGRNPTIAKPIKNLFLELVNDYNNAVFDNKKNNKIYCKNAISFIKTVQGVDMVYLDPPYYGCHPDYQAFYHFLETYVEYWKDKKLVNGTKQYFPKKKSGFTRKSEIISSFKQLFKNSSHIPYWLVSYNSKSYPTREVMAELIKPYKKIQLFEGEYLNHYGGRGSRKGTREYLFLCYE